MVRDDLNDVVGGLGNEEALTWQVMTLISPKVSRKLCASYP